MSGRPQHHDLGVERTTISCAIYDNGCLDLIELEPEEFYSGQHVVTWASILRLHRSGASVDLTTLRAELSRMGDLDRAGGDEALMALTESIPIVERVEEYAAIVRGHATVRRVLAASAQIQARAAEPIESTEAFLDEAEASIAAVSLSRRSDDGARHVKDVMIEAMDDLSKREEFGVTGLRTGFGALDRMLGGLDPGQLIIAAGRPGMGKSAFAQAIALQSAEQQDATVGVWSLEMTRVAWGRRFLMAKAGVDSARAKVGALTPADWSRLTTSAGAITNLPLHIDHAPGLTLYQLRARARRMKARHGLGLIVVDYLQLMRSHERLESKEVEIAELSKGLKALAGDLDVPVLALAQLNRDLEKRAEKRPIMADLRNSGAIEQDADVILFLYRDAVYNPKADPRHAEVIVEKQREGATGAVRVTWRAEYTRFEDADPAAFALDQRQLPGEFADPDVDYSSRRVGST